jgi:hypothetical protein
MTRPACTFLHCHTLGFGFVSYQFAFLAYHMLTMSFVYFNIWQIKQTRPEDFEKGLIGFSKDIENELLDASTPFVFSTVNERSILRLLKLIQCDNSMIGTYAKLVDDRNKSAHPNGQILYSTQAALDAKIAEVLRVVAEIQATPNPSSNTASGNSCSRATIPRTVNTPTTPTKSARY